mmetsp:Transcript_37739/g.97371  ORF Transcript_37739/g.97371 Transcript_37739/m.97371 type:complete len:137 (-) Transcript_37739:460-870(-)
MCICYLVGFSHWATRLVELKCIRSLCWPLLSSYSSLSYKQSLQKLWEGAQRKRQAIDRPPLFHSISHATLETVFSIRSIEQLRTPVQKPSGILHFRFASSNSILLDCSDANRRPKKGEGLELRTFGNEEQLELDAV